MKTIREIFRIGYGPSSSHTMGPRKAAEIFLEHHPDAAKYQAHLMLQSIKRTCMAVCRLQEKVT